MKRLIDAQEAFNVLTDYYHHSTHVQHLALQEALSKVPTVDAVPVRHAKWIDIDEQTYTWKVRCSCCGNERSMMSTQGKYPNYCEACGARMDAERGK